MQAGVVFLSSETRLNFRCHHISRVALLLVNRQQIHSCLGDALSEKAAWGEASRSDALCCCRDALMFDIGTIKLSDFGLSKSLPVNKHAGYDINATFRLTGENRLIQIHGT